MTSKELLARITSNEKLEKLYSEKTKSGKPTKFRINADIVMRELENQENGKAVNYSLLASIINVSYHDSGKIELAHSVDSTGHCDFCERMVKAAETNGNIVCKHCYDRKQELYRKNVFGSHYLNMIILSSFDFPIDTLKGFPIWADILRFNSSGDVNNQTHAENLLKIAINYPDKKIGFWFKNIAAVRAAVEKFGKPENVAFIQSSYEINKPGFRAEFSDCVFTVYSDASEIEKAIANGAGECNGKKCKDCGFKCYRNGWKHGANIAELLR